MKTEDDATTPARSPRRVRAPRGEGGRLREEILEAAARLLDETGDEDAVSIRAVAEAVGVTPPSIYLHFADKNELIFAICERYMDQLLRVSREAAESTDDPIESIRRGGRAYVRLGLENPAQYHVIFMRKPSATPLPWQRDKIVESGAFGHLRAQVRAGIEAGVLEGDELLVAIALWSAVHGITSLLLAKPNFPWPPVEDLVDAVTRSVLRGVERRTVTRSRPTR